MGEWASYVLARTQGPLESIGTLAVLTEGAISSQGFGPWVSSQLVEEGIYQHADLVLDQLHAATGAGAMVASLVDGDCLWIAGIDAAGRRFRCCVARRATADYLEDDDLDINEEFLSPDAALRALTIWADLGGMKPQLIKLERLLELDEFPNVGGPDYWIQLLLAVGLGEEAPPSAHRQLHPATSVNQARFGHQRHRCVGRDRRRLSGLPSFPLPGLARDLDVVVGTGLFIDRRMAMCLGRGRMALGIEP